jgi:DNA-binding CsgD family transcriptional regulator
MTVRSADPVAILEAAYDPETAGEAWVKRMHAMLHPLIDRGLGTAAYLFDCRSGPVEVAFPSLGVEMANGPAILARTIKSMRRDDVRRLYLDCPPCTTASAALGAELGRVWARPRKAGSPDAFRIRAEAQRGRGFLVYAPLPQIWRVQRRTALTFERIGSHIGAALRLRERLTSDASQVEIEQGDAVLFPSGKLAHATPAAKDLQSRRSLEEATRAVDRARGRLRRTNPEEAVALWRALVAGQWSLQDRFDHAGRRFVVAYRNPVPSWMTARRALSRRELQTVALAACGHSNKLIAYDLGLSMSAVSAYLRQAAKKLGVSSRVGMVRAYREGWGGRA